MKRVFKSILTLFIAVTMLSCYASANEMTFFENDFTVEISGNAGIGKSGKNVTALLIKTEADFEKPLPQDIAYIGQSTVLSDGSYEFCFPIEKEINTDEYCARVNCGGEDISASIIRAYAIEDNGKEYKIRVSNSGEDFEVEVTSDAGDTDYLPGVAFFDDNRSFLEAYIAGNGPVAYSFGQGSSFAKLLLWNSNMRPLMGVHRVNRGALITSYSVCYPGFTDKAITFSYDDDPASDAKLVELFNQYGFKATFNAVGNISNNDPAIYDGHEVISHGKKHLNMTDETYTTEECIADIVDEKAVLEDIFGEGTCRGFVWPYSAPVDREDYDVLMEAVRSNYDYCRKTPSTNRFDLPTDWHNWAPSCKHDDMNKLLPSFLGDNSDELKLFYIWGHAFEFTADYGGDWSTMENFLKSIKDENIWKATNGEIYDYVTASEKLVVNKTSIYNPTDTDIYVRLNGINTVIRAKETAYATLTKGAN